MRPSAPPRDSRELAVTASAPAVLQRARSSDFPEVQVSEDEARTFQRLVALSQQEPPRPEPSPAEIAAGGRGTIQWPALAFETVAIESPTLDNLRLE
jgi:hypothetical protein